MRAAVDDVEVFEPRRHRSVFGFSLSLGALDSRWRLPAGVTFWPPKDVDLAFLGMFYVFRVGGGVWLLHQHCSVCYLCRDVICGLQLQPGYRSAAELRCVARVSMGDLLERNHRRRVSRASVIARG